MDVNAFEQNFEGINESTFAPTEKILAEGIPGDIIAEIERLEQLNDEFNRIEGLDNLFCHVNKSDDDLLDTMVAEFGLEFPNFDIFNYVDPALDALLDAGVVDVLDRIDCEIRQPEFNLNILAVEGSYDLPNRCGMVDVDVPQTLEEAVGELQLLRRQLQQQQQLISELEEQIKSLKAIHMNSQQKQLQVEQVSTVEVHSKSDNNLSSPSGTSLFNPEESLQYGRLETIQERTKQRDERSVITQSEVVLEGEQQEPHLDETPYSNSKELQSSSRKELVSTLNRKRRSIHNGRRHVRKVEIGNSSLGTIDRLKSRERKQTESKKYGCKECTKSFDYKSNLTQHLIIHTGEKPHKCQLCTKSFNQMFNLTQHLIIHTGEKPHKCQLCTKSFNHKSTLTRHLIIHTGEKPHKCQLCTKSFKQKAGLTQHLMIHTGKKPHKCNFCNKSFRHRCNLLTHLKIHQN